MGFIALIIRNCFHGYIRKERISNGNKQNYLTVPETIRQLGKIEIVSIHDQGYRLAYAVTRMQKDILKVFGMNAADVKS